MPHYKKLSPTRFNADSYAHLSAMTISRQAVTDWLDDDEESIQPQGPRLLPPVRFSRRYVILGT